LRSGRALGESKDFLGIEISRDLTAGTITITQESKALALAAQVGVSQSQRALPMSSETYAGLRAAQPGEPMTDKLEFQRTLGSLLHLAQCTRPDIALPVSALAAFEAAPSEMHHGALLDVVRYVGSSAARMVSRTVESGSPWGSGVMQILLHARTRGGAQLVGL
jgi:hypothetical protein